MVVTNGGEVYAWGRTKNGRLGLGMGETSVTIPRKVQMGDHDGMAVAVEVGYVHSLIVLATGQLLVSGGVGVDDGEDGAAEGDDGVPNDGLPRLLDDPEVNMWQRNKDIVEKKEQAKWQKYGKYETKGRRAMMEEAKKWGV